MAIEHQSKNLGTTISEKFDSLGIWITGFTINGIHYGGHYVPKGDYRIVQFIEWMRAHAKNNADILECGCLEGGHTTLLSAAFPEATIHAVDVRPDNLTKAKLVSEILDCKNTTFLQDDFDSPEKYPQRFYDVVFCVGLLYHLRYPDKFLRSVCALSPVLWLWTVYCAEEEVNKTETSSRGRMLPESTDHPLSAVRSESYLPTLGSLVEFLWAAGYTKVDLLNKELTANGNGPAVLLCATR